jgi:hypothetical protein
VLALPQGPCIERLLHITASLQEPLLRTVGFIS